MRPPPHGQQAEPGFKHRAQALSLYEEGRMEKKERKQRGKGFPRAEGGSILLPP